MIPTELPIPVAEQQTPQIEAPEAESSQQGSQPDGEPGIPGSQPSISEGDLEDNQEVNPPGAELEGTQVPIPDSEDDNLTCECLLSVDTEPTALEEPVENLAWRCEVLIAQEDIDLWKSEEDPSDLIFVASAAKKQRSEVKLTSLSHSEQQEFQKAKESEISNWLKTGTVSRILRNRIPEDQILRCRWICTWKPLDQERFRRIRGPNTKRLKPD